MLDIPHEKDLKEEVDEKGFKTIEKVRYKSSHLKEKARFLFQKSKIKRKSFKYSHIFFYLKEKA